jgi:hypothetical protein
VGHPQVLVPRDYTRPEMAQAASARVGPGPGRLAGTHVLDLCAVGAMVLLCDSCNPKFVPKGVAYVRWWPQQPLRGRCDGCAQESHYAHGFLPETLHGAVGSASLGRRTRGRAARSVR